MMKVEANDLLCILRIPSYGFCVLERVTDFSDKRTPENHGSDGLTPARNGVGISCRINR